MKRIFTFLFAIVMAMCVWATVPQTISYQAVVRNHVGQLMKESKVGVKVTILHGSESGSVVYEETRVVTTNKNGLLTFAIGDENGSSRQSLSDIDWSDGIYFLRCDYDLQGGSNYEMTTSTQIKSVPYALYAERVSPNALPQWVQSEEKPTYSYAEIVDAPTVPTKVSELANDAKYITLQEVPAANVPTKLSELTNDTKFITKSDVPTKVSQLTNDADYAKKSELPSTDGLLSEADAAATYQPKGEYLTEHQSLADYAKKSDLPSTEGLLSEADAAATYQPKGEYLTEHQSLADYAKKSDLPSTEGLLSEADAAATYQPKGEYLTEHQSLADYAKKSDLPSTEGLLSEADAAATYQPKGEYLTEHQSLADYAKKSELPSTEGLLSEVEAAATYQPKGDYLTEHQSLADYAKKSELPSIEGLLSEADAAATYQPKGDYLTEHQSLAEYAKKSELPSTEGLLSEVEAAATYQPKGEYLTEHQSLAEYAKKSELPSTEGLLSEVDAAATYQPKGEYLTEHQSLAEYAKKSELPTVPAKVSAFENDANYITKVRFDSIVGVMNKAFESYNKTIEQQAKLIDSLKEVTATPATYKLSLTATPSASGTVSGAGSYEYGSKVTIVATPASGYSFDHWSDGNASASRTLTISANLSLAATFIEKITVTQGLLPGGFSVSDTKQVRFSKGNLQYQASTDTWRFAENQYDMIGADNKNISSTYSGWIDLFGWGTSGYRDAFDIYNKNYMPYSSSVSEVNETYNYYGYGPSTNLPSPDLTGSSANYDWGVYNAISNGGNKCGVWRTLTKSEWEYLYGKRTNAKELRGQAIVNGIKGYVLLPDDWAQPSSVSFNASPSEFKDNDYTISQWQVMESAGAVFLPCAGGRDRTTVGNVGTHGRYWSSTYYSSSNAYRFSFRISDVDPGDVNNRCVGHSVRLVQE